MSSTNYSLPFSELLSSYYTTETAEQEKVVKNYIEWLSPSAAMY